MIDISNVNDYIVYEVLSGSKAYGLDLPTSDTDIRGIFIIPNEYRLGLGYVEQVSDEKNDTVYYELNRYMELLLNNNPNIIENLFSSDSCVLRYDPILKPLFDNRNMFLTKRIKDSFGNYAISQINKARGLNKKIVNPVPKKRKTPLDFCYIFEKNDGYMMLAKQWLRKKNMKQEYIGLSELPNGIQTFKVFYDWDGENNPNNVLGFKGIISENGNELRHSEIPKNHKLEAFLFFNLNGYSSYCKDYKEYWEWVSKRNPVRYNDNINNKQNYDGKNMMHCIRLLDMAIEIGEGKGVNMIRHDRDWLLSIKKGLIGYDEIMSIVESKKMRLNEIYQSCNLPDSVDPKLVHDIIVQIRNNYGR